jgi:hypothetical protein
MAASALIIASWPALSASMHSRTDGASDTSSPACRSVSAVPIEPTAEPTPA